MQIRLLLAVIVEHVVPGQGANVERIYRRDDRNKGQAQQRDEKYMKPDATAAGAAETATLLRVRGHGMCVELLQFLATDVYLEIYRLTLLATPLNGACVDRVLF